MNSFLYASSPHAVPEEIADAHRSAWHRIASPGSWWTGTQRVEAARLARDVRSRRSLPPWQRTAPLSEPDILPDRAVELVLKVAVDVHALNAEWVADWVEEFGDAAYAELCAVVVCTTVIDAFAEALGVDLEPLPAALPGEPDRVRPEGVAEAGAFVPTAKGLPGPNVSKALGLVPLDNAAFFGLVGSMYALKRFSELVWDESALSRPQVELVAARVSSVNECFY
ncbi:MAG: hypothetical protein P8Q97_02165 [Myxococcota bacterium]|nr:hypothetical protein [Myxococcota bacterium]